MAVNERGKALMQLSNGVVVEIESLMNYDVMENIWSPRVIAHSLSQITRYTGHTKFPYWVGQHALLVMQLVGFEHPELMLEALNHDDAEAFVNDLHGGLKHQEGMGYYQDLEFGIQNAINAYHGFPVRAYAMHPAIKKADMLARSIEAYNLMDYKAEVWQKHFKQYPVIPYVVEEKRSKDVENEWLNAYWYLVNSNPEQRKRIEDIDRRRKERQSKLIDELMVKRKLAERDILLTSKRSLLPHEVAAQALKEALDESPKPKEVPWYEGNDNQ